MSKVKTLIIALFIIAAVALPVWAQTEAGFLDQLAPVQDPYSLYSGSAWYCMDSYTDPENPFNVIRYIIAGPFQTQPNCNEY